jgi:hypothetical protein
VPLVVALLAFGLLMPRAAPPEGIPMPMTDVQALERIASHDRELAAQARREPLPGEVRGLGSAFRDFNLLQAKRGDVVAIGQARAAIDSATAPALAAGIDKLLVLRATQTEAFLEEVRRFEATGTESEELLALGGPFVSRMKDAGWCDDDHHVLLDDAQRRAAFKATWAAMLNLDARPEMKPSLDETRALYTLFLRYPHPPEGLRESTREQRKLAKDARACADIDARELEGTAQWRLEKLKKLGALDPSYPLAYAVGVEQYRRGNNAAAVAAFKSWLEAHPNGPYSLRARNYLKASLEAAAY